MNSRSVMFCLYDSINGTNQLCLFVFMSLLTQSKDLNIAMLSIVIIQTFTVSEYQAGIKSSTFSQQCHGNASWFCIVLKMHGTAYDRTAYVALNSNAPFCINVAQKWKQHTFLLCDSPFQMYSSLGDEGICNRQMFVSNLFVVFVYTVQYCFVFI